MDQVLIYGQRVKDKDLEYINNLFSLLQSTGTRYFVTREFLEAAEDKLELKQSQGTISSTEQLRSHDIDAVITLGGDGTILNAMTLILDTGVPILGINLGRLGFLSSVEKTKINICAISLGIL